MNKRNNMPKISNIINYWNENYLKLGKTKYGYIPLTNDCFSCGDHLCIERAHIIPLCAGGQNNEINIHLLCKRCHIESEFYTEYGYWNWIKYKRSNEYELTKIHSLNRLIKAGFNYNRMETNKEKVISEVSSIYYFTAAQLNNFILSLNS